MSDERMRTITDLLNTPLADRDFDWKADLAEALAELIKEDPTPTLGEIAEVMRGWKKVGVGLDCVQYVCKRVWWEEDW